MKNRPMNIRTYEHPRWFPLSIIQIKHGGLSEYAWDWTVPVSNAEDLAQSRYLGRVYLSFCEVCLHPSTVAASVFSVFWGHVWEKNYWQRKVKPYEKERRNYWKESIYNKKVRKWLTPTISTYEPWKYQRVFGKLLTRNSRTSSTLFIT
jgi:hypothetical protein